MKHVFLSLVVVLLAIEVRAGEPADAKAVVKSYVAAFSKGDLKAAMPLVAGEAGKTLAINFARVATGAMRVKDTPEFAEVTAKDDVSLVQTHLEAARKIDTDFKKVKFLFVLKTVEGKSRIVLIKPQSWDAPAKEEYATSALPDASAQEKEFEEMKKAMGK